MISVLQTGSSVIAADCIDTLNSDTSDGDIDDYKSKQSRAFENDRAYANDQLFARLDQIDELEDAIDVRETHEDDKLLGLATIRVHSEQGVYGLTARTRLPDSILIPNTEDGDV
jgi:hypothetical protein